MDIMNLKELTQYLNVSESLIRKLVRDGTIKYFRIGNRLNFRKSDIDEYIDMQCNANYKGNNEDIMEEVSIKRLK